MKKLYILLIALLISTITFGQTVFINEIHYDNSGADSGEGVEIAGPAGTDLSTYTLTPYNGNGGAPYSATALSGSIPDEGSGYGAVWFAIIGLQNGSPDGIALDNSGSLIQFLSYEGTFVAVGGPADTVMSTDIGVSEAGSAAAGSSLQLTGSGLIYSNFSWATETTASPGLINSGQTFGTPTPALAITSPADFAVFPPGTTSVDVSISVQNFNVANGTGDGHIHWNIDGGSNMMKYDTNDESVPVLDGNSYTVYMELVNNSHTPLTPAVNQTINFSVATLTPVTDIAALRTDFISNGSGFYYEITGASLVTHTDGFNNRQWIQDGNSGIVMYDFGGISTTYTVGDNVSGLKGYTEVSNGLLRFVPFEDSGIVDSSGNPVVPQVVTIADFNAAPDDYESKLIRINNVTFVDGNGVTTFGTGTNYNVTDGVNTVVKRTDFFSADYIGTIIPSGQIPGIIGVAGEFNGTSQIYVRNLSDMTLSTNEINLHNFKVFPNPTRLGHVNIFSRNNAAMNIKVFDILGKQVINTTLNNNKLDVSNLNSGIYIMKVSQGDATTTKKLVIQ